MRKSGYLIGRTFYVHLSSGKLYYLKLLLNHQTIATSFESLRTIDSITYPTNQAACNALGLLGDDKEWNESILEASFWSTSHQLRQLFTIILLFCNVNNPTTLLQNHWKLMTEDIQHRIKTSFNNSNFQIPDHPKVHGHKTPSAPGRQFLHSSFSSFFYTIQKPPRHPYRARPYAAAAGQLDACDRIRMLGRRGYRVMLRGLDTLRIP